MARSRLLLVAAATTFAILVLAPLTLAGDGQSTQEVYGGEAGNVQAQVEQGVQGDEAVLTSSGGESLPLTGLNLALIVIVGAVLVGSGLMLRRRGKAPE